MFVHLGHLAATPGALAAITEANQQPFELLARHARGDWGVLCPEDRRANERALRCGQRLLSAYPLASGRRVWIITEADRSTTTLLLPEEY